MLMKQIILAGLIAGILLFGISAISQDEDITGMGILDNFKNAKMKQATSKQQAPFLEKYAEETKSKGTFEPSTIPLPSVPISCGAVGTEFCVNVNQTYDEGTSQSIDASTEKFIVAWHRMPQGSAGPFSGTTLFARAFDSASGAALSGDIPIATTPPYSNLIGDVAILNNGGFVTAWLNRTIGGNPNDADILAKVYDNTFNPIVGEFIVHPKHAAGLQGGVSVAALSNGNFVVVWEDNMGLDGSYTIGDNGVFGQVFDPLGNFIGGQFQINTYSISNQVHPAVDASPNGGFVVVWESALQDGDWLGVYGQRFDDDASPIGSEFQVNSVGSGSQEAPRVAYLYNGDFVVVWNRWVPSHGTAIEARHFDTNANPLGPEFQINSIAYPYPGFINADVDGKTYQEGYIITWENTDFFKEGDAYTRVYDNLDQPLATEQMVNSYNIERQDFPSVASHRSGHIIVWSSNEQIGKGYEIYGQRYDLNNNPI